MWRDRRKDPACLLLLCWLIPGAILFCAIGTKLPHYLLPLYPALALAVARSLASDLGLTLDAVAWDGASDANIAAHAGAATLDGFGPLGEGAHQPTESIVVDALPPRLALFAELVCSLAEPPERWMGEEALGQLHARRGSSSA